MLPWLSRKLEEAVLYLIAAVLGNSCVALPCLSMRLEEGAVLYLFAAVLGLSFFARSINEVEDVVLYLVAATSRRLLLPRLSKRWRRLCLFYLVAAVALSIKDAGEGCAILASCCSVLMSLGYCPVSF